MTNNFPTEEDNGYFITTDLGCAAAMISKGLGFPRLDKTDPQKVRFIFSSSPDVREAADDYWSSSLLVVAKSMTDNMKTLKNKIYSN